MTLSQTTMVRNGTVKITVANAPTVDRAIIYLRGGRPIPPIEVLLKRFQESKGLPPDGVVGPTTRAALGI